MNRRIIAFLLVAMSLWQAAAATGLAQACLARDAELAHLTLHWQAEGHHHDADGSIHADDTPAALQHAMADCSTHHPVLIIVPPLATLDRAVQGVAPLAQPKPPTPYLDGLQRPPQALS